MRKFLTSLMLLVLLSPNMIKAEGFNAIRTKSGEESHRNQKTNDTYLPVYEVKAEAIDDNNAKIRWSWDEIIPDKYMINFESGDISQGDFDNSVSNFPWVITENAFDGSYAIKSTNEGIGGSTSAIEITVEVPYNGVMGFNNRISSEAEYDVANFYIDGVKMLETSGLKSWGYREFEITEGTHTYRWEYVKDNNMDKGDDAFFLDNIMLFGEVEPFEGGWIHYDDGEFVESVGPGFEIPMHWAIKFPKTESYAGLTLTKVSLYDADPRFVGACTANIYVGGDDCPGTLVSTQNTQLKGIKEYIEVELSTPVTLDGTEPLWISFSTTNITAPAAACAYADDINSDWVSMDGTNWEHLVSDYDFQYSWMVRGYLENSRGEVLTLGNVNDKYQDRGTEFKSYKLYRHNNFAGEISAQTVDVVAENITDTVFFDNGWASIEDGSYIWGVAAVYDDNKAESGNYSFQNDNESVIVWSNVVDKNMLAKVDVEITTNNDETAEGTLVKFINLSEPEMGYDYEIVLDETGVYSWNKFRKGTYELTIYKSAYTSCADGEIIEVWDDSTIECQLEEIISSVGDLYVSPTAWAMWSVNEDDAATSYDVYLDGDLEDNVTTTYYQHSDLVVGQSYTTSVVANYATDSSDPMSYTWTYKGGDSYEGVTDFTAKFANGKAVLNWVVPGMDVNNELITLSYGFEDGMENWTTIDGNEDEHIWYHNSECAEHIIENCDSHTGEGHICSESFCNAMGEALVPDDYVVSPEKVVATESSKIKFWVSARDAAWAADHFGVAVSVDGNSSASDFNTIAEWTMISKGNSVRSERDSKDQGAWHQFEADLSSYSGQEIWVALRHFNCTDMYMLLVDDIELVDVIAVNEKLDDAVCIGAMVYRDGELLTPQPITSGRFSESMQVGTEREYCVRAVHGGEMDESYYAMSNPECITLFAEITCDAPEDLYGVQSADDNDNPGVLLVWPYAKPTSDWLYYDSGISVDGIGGPESFSWAVMFPSSSLIGYESPSLTKVAMYMNVDVSSSGFIYIYSGGSTSPNKMLHSQQYSVAGAGEFVEIELTKPVDIDITKNLWIVVSTFQGSNFPAAVSADCGNPNSRWISMDGTTWEDMKDYGLNYSWILRGFVSQGGKGQSELRSLDHYNVYRSTTTDDFEFIAETNDGSYFDAVDYGTYYYQVTAVYTEYGEECESEPATAYENAEQNYVEVKVIPISVDKNNVVGMMIYPNPTSNILNVKVDAMTRISVMNALGQIVYSQDVSTDNVVIDMSQYESGIYLLHITTDNGVAVQRISVVK